jgi:hypothetical protein
MNCLKRTSNRQNGPQKDAHLERSWSFLIASLSDAQPRKTKQNHATRPYLFEHGSTRTHVMIYVQITIRLYKSIALPPQIKPVLRKPELMFIAVSNSHIANNLKSMKTRPDRRLEVGSISISSSFYLGCSVQY